MAPPYARRGQVCEMHEAPLYDRIVHNFVSYRQTALCPAADGVRATGRQLCLADRALIGNNAADAF